MGRLLFIGAVALLAGGMLRFAATDSAVWSRAMKTGGMNHLIGGDGRFFLARMQSNQVWSITASRSQAVTVSRPLRLIPDGRNDFYVLSLLRGVVTWLRATDLSAREIAFSPSCYVQGMAVEPDGAWIAGFFKGRVDDEKKRHFYLPEYGTFEWFLLHEKPPLPSRLTVGDKARLFRNEVWHEESGGGWSLLPAGDSLILVNDQAESVASLRRADGELQWRSATAKRPVAALLSGDLVIVASGQDGVIEGFRLADGAKAWQTEVGRGLTDAVLFQDLVVAADWAGDRIVALEPAGGKIVRETGLSGAPRVLWADRDRLWIGLEAANRLVGWDAQWRETDRIGLSDGEGR